MSIGIHANRCGPSNPNWRGGGLKFCKRCGGAFNSPKKTKVYCSKECRVIAQRGSGNPNFRNAAPRVCLGCGCTFESYNKARKYCSKPCHVKHRVVTPELSEKYRQAGLKSQTGARRKGTGKGTRGICKECGVEFYFKTRRLYCEKHQSIARTKGILASARKKTRPKNRPCRQCGAMFRAGPRSAQKFCSYSCFIESGGAIRAGLEAKRMTSIYGAKKDANHREITDALRKLHVPFIDLSALGYGVPDLVVQVRGRLELWEVKNRKTRYGKRGLNKNQKAWAANWTGNPVVIVHSVDDVIARLSSGDEALQAVGAVR